MAYFGQAGQKKVNETAIIMACGESGKRLQAMAQKLTGSREYAEDIVQEAYLRVLSSSRDYGEENIIPVLFVTVKHLCINHNKRMNRIPQVPLENHCIAYHPEEEQESPFEIFTEDFSEIHRELMRLRYIEKVSMVNIAKSLGVSDRTVRRHLSCIKNIIRAKKKGALREGEIE
jgi:RNA polymerase sigma factor (sigma-70 family)